MQSKPRAQPPLAVAQDPAAAAEPTSKAVSTAAGKALGKVAKVAKVARVGKEGEEVAAVVEAVAAKGKGAVSPPSEGLLHEGADCSASRLDGTEAPLNPSGAVPEVAKARPKPVPSVAPPGVAGHKARRQKPAPSPVAATRAPRAPRPPPAARPSKGAPRTESPRASGWWESLPWEELEASATGEAGGKAEERTADLAAGTWAQPDGTADAWARRVLYRARRADAAPHVILASGAAQAQAIAAGIRRL